MNLLKKNLKNKTLFHIESINIKGLKYRSIKPSTNYNLNSVGFALLGVRKLYHLLLTYNSWFHKIKDKWAISTNKIFFYGNKSSDFMISIRLV